MKSFKSIRKYTFQTLVSFWLQTSLEYWHTKRQNFLKKLLEINIKNGGIHYHKRYEINLLKLELIKEIPQNTAHAVLWVHGFLSCWPVPPFHWLYCKVAHYTRLPLIKASQMISKGHESQNEILVSSILPKKWTWTGLLGEKFFLCMKWENWKKQKALSKSLVASCKLLKKT